MKTHLPFVLLFWRKVSWFLYENETKANIVKSVVVVSLAQQSTVCIICGRNLKQADLADCITCRIVSIYGINFLPIYIFQEMLSGWSRWKGRGTLYKSWIYIHVSAHERKREDMATGCPSLLLGYSFSQVANWIRHKAILPFNQGSTCSIHFLPPCNWHSGLQWQKAQKWLSS